MINRIFNYSTSITGLHAGWWGNLSTSSTRTPRSWTSSSNPTVHNYLSTRRKPLRLTLGEALMLPFLVSIILHMLSKRSKSSHKLLLNQFPNSISSNSKSNNKLLKDKIPTEANSNSSRATTILNRIKCKIDILVPWWEDRKLLSNLKPPKDHTQDSPLSPTTANHTCINTSELLSSFTVSIESLHW